MTTADTRITKLLITGNIDTREKREAYAELGIPEYWRFDETEARIRELEAKLRRLPERLTLLASAF